MSKQPSAEERLWRKQHPEEWAEEKHRRHLEYQHRWRAAHPEKVALWNEQNTLWRKNNRDHVNRRAREYVASHPEQAKATQRRFKAKHPDAFRLYNLKRKVEMVDSYGGKCACCGETEIAFLSLDHANGGGTQHRLRMGQNKMMAELRAAGWPKDGYRILCMNCQFGTRYGHECPHTRFKEVPG